MKSTRGGKDDDFWDIEYITPVRKASPSVGADTSAVFLSFGEDTADGAEEGKKIPSASERRARAKSIIDSFEKKTSELLLEYKPDNPLFESVRVCRWPTSYTFYERFVTDAEKYYRVKCDECEYVSFFSYMPQYNQLSLSQLRYYIWWRRNLRHGVFLRTDYSYIFLFFYEIINLENVSTPEKRLNALCTVWLAYRDKFPKLDRYAGEWVCDFCLIHRLPMPQARLNDILPQVCETVSLREFYTTREPHAPSILSFIRANTTYDYRRSSLYEKNKALFDAHIYKAAAYALQKTQLQDEKSVSLSKTRISRDAYSGALCVCSVKRRIDIEYYSFCHSYKHRGVITSLVRYAENCVRASLNLRSRLSAPSLPQSLKAAADEYFAVNLPAKSAVSAERAEEAARYELYEAKSSGLCAEDAAQLERSSWEFAQTLIPPQESEEPTDAEEGFMPTGFDFQSASQPRISSYGEFLEALSPLQHRVISLLYRRDAAGAEAVCRECGALLDAVADEINAAAGDMTGDIIISELEIIDEYRDELKDYLKE